MKNKKAVKFLILISIFAAISYLMADIQREAVEKLGVSSGVGFDIEAKSDSNFIYSLPISVYVISENKQESKVYTGKGPSIGETRQDRQRKFDKRFLLGFEKVYILSEDYAKKGINTASEILFKNQAVNDIGFVCVCKGKSEDLLKMKLEGYPSSADFIDGLIRSSKDFNFLTKNYKLLDLYVRVDSEGRCLVLPYIEVINNEIQITGLAIFKRDKMMVKLNMENARLLSILKENKTNGIVAIQKDAEDYADFILTSKRKIQCYKEEGKYRFNINIELKGDLVSNQLSEYDKKIDNPQEMKSLEETISKDMEKKLNGFIEIIKNEYKIDCLELGRVAAAKYGREDNKKWDDIVCNSEIKVNVKTKIDRTGRGDY